MLRGRVRTAALLVLAIPLVLVAHQPASTAFDGFDMFVAGVMREWKVPGLAVAVIKDGTCTVSAGPAVNPNLTLQMAGQDWLDMLSGKQSGQMLFMSGKLKVKGDMGLAMKLGSMFQM